MMGKMDGARAEAVWKVDSRNGKSGRQGSAEATRASHIIGNCMPSRLCRASIQGKIEAQGNTITFSFRARLGSVKFGDYRV
jgi:hypothetical protein